MLDQHPLRLRHDVGVDLVGQVVQRPGDDVGLRGRHVPTRMRGRQDRPPAIQRPGQRQVPACDTAVDPGLPPAPGRHVPIRRLLGHLVRHRQQPQPRRRDPRLQPRQLLQTLGLLGRREVQQLERLDLVQGRRDRLTTLLNQVSARHLHPPQIELWRGSRGGAAAHSQFSRTYVRSAYPKLGKVDGMSQDIGDTPADLVFTLRAEHRGGWPPRDPSPPCPSRSLAVEPRGWSTWSRTGRSATASRRPTTGCGES